MDQQIETVGLRVNCLDTQRQLTQQKVTPVITLDAIVIAKLVCLSEEAQWRVNRNAPGSKQPPC